MEGEIWEVGLGLLGVCGGACVGVAGGGVAVKGVRGMRAAVERGVPCIGVCGRACVGVAGGGVTGMGPRMEEGGVTGMGGRRAEAAWEIGVEGVCVGAGMGIGRGDTGGVGV